MNDCAVFNDKDMPSRILNVRYTLCKDGFREIGEVIYYTKRNIANELVEKILENEKFFQVKECQFNFTELSANCVVLTLEEYRDNMTLQFKRGRDSGIGMMQPYDFKDNL